MRPDVLDDFTTTRRCTNQPTNRPPIAKTVAREKKTRKVLVQVAKKVIEPQTER